jgi:DNA-binding response OmpR family regulator
MAHVLLLEPDVRMGETYAAGLRTQQHEVVWCATAQEAICQADCQRPDVVLLELQLAQHSGIEFLYEFRTYEDWREVPVIIVSSVPPAEFAASMDSLRRRLGVRAYHYKPHTSLRTLIQAVEAALAPTIS